ncbi:MAG: hypothetical protein ACI9OD_005012, partial [Limisphaerales bacterium]
HKAVFEHIPHYFKKCGAKPALAGVTIHVQEIGQAVNLVLVYFPIAGDLPDERNVESFVGWCRFGHISFGDAFAIRG